MCSSKDRPIIYQPELAANLNLLSYCWKCWQFDTVDVISRLVQSDI